MKTTLFSHRTRLCLLSMAGGLLLPLAATAQSDTWYNSTFIIENLAGYDAENTYVTFFGQMIDQTGNGASAQTYGAGTAFSYSNDKTYQSFTLASLWDADFSYTQNGVSKTGAYTFTVNDFENARIYFTQAPLSAAPDNTQWQGLVELYVKGLQSGATPNAPVVNNWDVSYVDGVSMPIQTTLYNAAGTPYSAQTVNPVLTSPAILAALAAQLPSSAIVSGSSGVQRIVSPAHSASFGGAGEYHDWSALITHLTAESTEGRHLQVANYTAPLNSGSVNLNQYNLSGAQFGFNGVSGELPVYEHEGPNMFNGQNYDFSANFVSDLYASATPQQQAEFDANPAWGITATSQTSGVILSGSTTAVGGDEPTPPFTLFITNAELNKSTGIYGSNPKYIVIPETVVPSGPGAFVSYQTEGIHNDVTGRIVGDLMAGMVFGWAGSTVKVADVFNAQFAPGTATTDLWEALVTSMAAYGTTLDADTTFGELTTGQYFMMMSLGASNGIAEGTPGDFPVMAWTGAAIARDATAFDEYTALLLGLTQGYGTGFGDRFNGLLNPDTTWYSVNPGGAVVNPVTGLPFQTLGYGAITLLAPAPVPEASTLSLSLVLLSGGVGLWWRQRRKRHGLAG